MSKQSMHKSMGRAGAGGVGGVGGGGGGGGGGGESSSGTRKQQPPRDGDYEVALRLQKKLDEDSGYPDHRQHHRKEFSDHQSHHQKEFSDHRPHHEKEFSNHRPHHQKESPKDSRTPGKTAHLKTSSGDPAAPYPKEVQDALNEVQKFVADVMETTCRKCDSALMRNFDAHRWFKQWASTKSQPEPTSICSLTCSNKDCQALTCMGCGEKPRMGKYTGKIDGFHLDWCCQSGRQFALWCLLSEFDNLELAEEDRSRRQIQQSSAQPKNGFPSTRKKGTGYDGDDGGFYMYSPHFAVTPTLHLNRAGSKTDASTKQMLALIIELLPRRSDKSKAAPPVLGALIELSLVQDRIAELLRNDSLQDITTRAGLYFAVFEFFERLGKHPDTSYLIHEERFVKKQSSGLFVISTSKDLKGKGKARESRHLILGQGEDRTTASLLACMSNIATQSEALLKASRMVKDEFRTADAKDLLEVADRIAKLQLSMKPNGADGEKEGPGSKSDKDMTWKEYNQKYCVTREENVLRSLVGRLATEANILRHSPPNRIKRLVTEASEMETSLPPNVFVKVDEVRPDVMKCLIIGPEGTPYEAGLFEFDIFCPLNYPHSPPKVIFRNTAGGRIAFNPNLHPDGLVCLSLLGTFPGPPESKWQGERSSILSVLVSIQAMIFCPNPMENLPAGLEYAFRNKYGIPPSASYKFLVQAWTVRYAMLDWLQNKDMRKGLWHDAVRTYFERNGGAILDMVSKWRVTNKLIGSFDEMGARAYAQMAYGQNAYGSAGSRDLGRELAKALQPFRQNRRSL